MPDDAFPVDVSAAQEEFTRLKRKANKRKADRDRLRRKRPAKPRPSAPLVQVAKAFTPEQREHWFTGLCVHLVEGGSLRSFVRDHPDGPAHATWFEWLAGDAMMADRYALARERSADTLAEDCVLIADEVKDAGHMDSARVNAARLRVDARKWVASKLKPKVYADRLETVASGALTVKHEITDDDRAKVLATLLARQAIAATPNMLAAQRLIEASAKDVTPKQETTARPSMTATSKDQP
jgi:hypothetical protein